MGTPTSRVPLQDSFFQRIVKNREGLCVVGDKERRTIRFLTRIFLFDKNTRVESGKRKERRGKNRGFVGVEARCGVESVLLQQRGLLW
ncbi:hypothetical protein KQX54_005918 [Cotesia glomerata]|uniref:Uncharacterized protein n=1 Tax=Cotesia glomerata TaxID=32391 RepID=A0AAV7J6G3_COTGL|nr:hypothetical protein KQX54_005918 [Cotesia glomerata]